MADYRCSVKPRLSRGKGASVARAASYIAREKLKDERTGELYDFSGLKDRALWTGIYAPKNAPEWAQDLQQFVHEIERAEKRKDSQLALPIELSLAHELSVEKNRWMMQDFIRENFTRHGYATLAAIHEPPEGGDPRNIHAHLLVTLRTMDENGFAKTKEEQQKNYMERRNLVKDLRQSWEKHLKKHLKRHGFEREAEAVSCKSLKERGIEREPQYHLGPTASDMERKGKKTKRGELNREAKERSEQLVKLEAADKEIAQAIIEAEKQLEKETRQQKEQAERLAQESRARQEREASREQQPKRAQAPSQRWETERGRLDKAQDNKAQRGAEPSKSRETAKAADALDRGLGKTANTAGRLTSGFMNAVDRALDFLVGAPAQKAYTPAELARNPAARREMNQQALANQTAARNRAHVLDDWQEQLEKSGHDFTSLSPADLQHLNKIDLQNIKAKGEETILALLEERERERYRQMGWELDRER